MRILITGASGFIGKNLVKFLQDNTDYKLFTPSSSQLDLLNPVFEQYLSEDGIFDYPLMGPEAISYYLKDNEINTVVHLAGKVGGIGFNQGHQGSLGYANMQMGMNILEGARFAKVRRLIMIGTTCSYPHTPKTIPFIEEELFDGMPEITNSGYGIMKRALMKMCMDYAEEFGMEITNLIPTNMYGPRDCFDDDRSHVIPALIKKFERPIIGVSAYPNTSVPPCVTSKIRVWGSGQASRDFLYVEDFVRAIAICLERRTGPQPINLGSGQEVTIRKLAETIRRVGEYNSDILWDQSKPDGQQRRVLDITRARNILRWEPRVSLEEGLRRTIAWYKERQQ